MNKKINKQKKIDELIISDDTNGVQKNISLENKVIEKSLDSEKNF